MVQYNVERVYREDWGFRLVSTEERFAREKGFIKNGDINRLGKHDYMDVDDFDLCLEVDEALYELKYNLFELLADRVYFEYDLDNTVILTFVKAINKSWLESNEWEYAVDLLSNVEDGKYDDEMKRYYAYLQAMATLENIKLIDFSDEDNIEESLEVNNIYVYDDDIFFRVAGVVDSVERTYDLENDVKRLLVVVMRSLKNTGELVDFTRGFQY